MRRPFEIVVNSAAAFILPNTSESHICPTCSDSHYIQDCKSKTLKCHLCGNAQD